MKRRIGKFDYEKLIVPGALLVGGYLVLNKLGLFGSPASAANNAAIDQSTGTTVAAAIVVAKSKGITQTIDDLQLSGIATYIYDSGSSPDQDQVVSTIMEVQNIADWLRLIQLFGTKQASADFWSTCNWLGFNCQSLDLPSFLRLQLDAGHLSAINSFFQSIGINYSL